MHVHRQHHQVRAHVPRIILRLVLLPAGVQLRLRVHGQHVIAPQRVYRHAQQICRINATGKRDGDAALFPQPFDQFCFLFLSIHWAFCLLFGLLYHIPPRAKSPRSGQFELPPIC